MSKVILAFYFNLKRLKLFFRKSRSLEDFDSLGDSRENINASAPDLTANVSHLEQS